MRKSISSISKISGLNVKDVCVEPKLFECRCGVNKKILESVKIPSFLSRVFLGERTFQERSIKLKLLSRKPTEHIQTKREAGNSSTKQEGIWIRCQKPWTKTLLAGSSQDLQVINNHGYIVSPLSRIVKQVLGWSWKVGMSSTPLKISGTWDPAPSKAVDTSVEQRHNEAWHDIRPGTRKPF